MFVCGVARLPIIAEYLLSSCADALITGYVDPPPGVEIREGMNYNPYFPGSPRIIRFEKCEPDFPDLTGGAIGMARILYDGLVEYPDGAADDFDLA